MLFIIVGLVVGVGGFSLGNYLLNETIKTLAVFLGGLFCGAGVATHPRTQAIAKQVETKLDSFAQGFRDGRAEAKANENK